MKNLIYLFTLLLLISCGNNNNTNPTKSTEKYVGEVLPFTPPPMPAKHARLQDSKMKWPKQEQHLPKDAPNVLIIMLDDVGFGVAETFGGGVKTPNLKKLADEGIMYNAFHTTSICSPTRAALLTGRNHTRVGYGSIAERAVAWDGYTGIMPKTGATIAEVFKDYGYRTSAFGKWHNTPALETTTVGPKEHWPNNYGFEYFYGFFGGATSQYEPRLFENYNPIEPPIHDETYHLTEDLMEKALKWLDDKQAYTPDQPFLMYWTPAAVHGPHHVFKEWTEKYKGKFDDGWDAYREATFKRQLEMGIIPKGTKLTPRDKTMDSWESIPENEKDFQRRLMEVYAGFVEHTDVQVGKLIDGLEERGLKDNTIIIYIFGDNGSSSEGQQGTISEILGQNNIPTKISQHIAALKPIGGLDALGGHKVDNQYHAGWAWAGSTPFKGVKLMGAYFGGTRNPMVISWPKKIKPQKEIISEFLHVVDIAPTLYEVIGIKPPRVVNGLDQLPIDGVSFAYTFDEKYPKREKANQFFDNNGSRGIYADGYFAGTFGPLIPWNKPLSKKNWPTWDSEKDQWELYKLDEDFSQANDLAKSDPEKLEEMKELYLKVAEENKDFPIGAGMWLRLHPEDRRETPYTEWHLTQNTRRMPEFAAPGLGRENNTVTLDIEVDKNASGVIYALGGYAGGLSLYMDKGYLYYEYNFFLIHKYETRSQKPIAPGKHKIEVVTTRAKLGGPLKAVLKVDGKEVAQLNTEVSLTAIFSPSETLDVGIDLGSPVSERYYDRRPFEFNGKIKNVHMVLNK